MNSSSLHILSLTIHNFKRITAAQIDPVDLKPVIISGDNAQGKSSAIDAILTVLDKNAVSKPIKDGATKAVVTLKIGDNDVRFTVERSFTGAGNSYLKILDADGAQVPQAATFLESIYSKVAIDPLMLMGMKAKDQAEALKGALGIKDALADIEQRISAAEAERTVINRNRKTSEAALEQMAVAPAGTPDEPVDISTLAARAAEAMEIIQRHDRLVADARLKANQAQTVATAIDELKARLTELLKQSDTLTKELSEAEEKAEAARAAADEARAIHASSSERIRTAELTNRHVTTKQQRKAKQAEVLRLRTESLDVEQRITTLRAEKQKAVTDTRIPVEGLTITDDGLFKDGIPLEDLNTAEQIKVCAALAMMSNDKLKIMVIREGALMNKKNRELLFSIAAEHGYQVWMERFAEENDGDGIWIQDGQITA